MQIKIFRVNLWAAQRQEKIPIFRTGSNLVGISFGDLCIVSLPAEPFVEIGLKIKNEIITGKTVMIATHSGTGADHISGGYIPNAFNFGRGGYESTHRSCPFAHHTADKLAEGISLLNKKLDA